MRMKALAATAATLMVAGLVIVVAEQSSSGASASAARVRTLTVVERALTDTTVDLAPAGDSRGDQLAFQNPVYDAQNSMRVGHDLGSCVRTAAGVAYQCSWTLVLKQGSIVVEGPFLDKGDSTLAIIGGTGEYARARGGMRLHALDSAGTKYRFTYRILH